MQNVYEVKTKEEFYEFFKNDETKGFVKGYWGEEKWIEEEIKKDLNVTIRCIPLEQSNQEGVCIISGKKASKQVIYAKAY